MTETRSLMALIEGLKHSAVQLELLYKDGKRQLAHAEARITLSLASRTHARLTALIEALSEMETDKL